MAKLQKAWSMAILHLNTQKHLLKEKPWYLLPPMAPNCCTWHLGQGGRSNYHRIFPNLDAVCDYLDGPAPAGNLPRAWKDRINIEDMLFAGAVIEKVKNHFEINCDSSQIAETLYSKAKKDLYGFMQAKNASHYIRLSNYGLEKDIR